MAAMKLPSFNAPAAGIGTHSGHLQILGAAGFAGSPFHLLRRRDGFHPMSASVLHSAAVSLEMKKSANALTFAGRARAVAVAKYRPPSGKRQSVKTGSSCLPRKYCVATNSGSSVMASPARTVGSNASTLVPRSAPVGVTVHSSPLVWVKRQTSRLVLLV